MLSSGDPVFIAGFLIAVHCLTVFFIYLLGLEMFNKRVGFIAAFLFAISYGSIIYSRWLSSHPLSIPLATLFFFFLYRYKKGDVKSLLGVAISFSLLGQAEFLNFLFFGLVLLVIFVVERKKLFKEKRSTLAIFLLSLVVLSTINYILFDIRNNFLITKSLLGLAGGKSGYYINFIQSLTKTIDVFLSSVQSFIAPTAPHFITVLVLIAALLIIFKRNEKKQALYLGVWIGGPVILLVLLRHDVLEQFFVGTAPATILLVAVSIDHLLKKSQLVGLMFFGVIMYTQFAAWNQNIPENKNHFFQATQGGLKISDQKKVIDTIYRRANKTPFSFQSYTIPYWHQQAWEYLFWQYGQQKYGVYPIPEKARLLYVIVQDDPSNTVYQSGWLRETVMKWGKEEKEFRYGVLSVKELHTDKKN